MSDDEKDQRRQDVDAQPQRQPVFLLPAIVMALCGLLLAIQAADSLVLNNSGRELLLTWFAFIPYRAIETDAFPGGWLPLLWTPLTHALLHSGWEHVLLNTVWLAIFATPVAQRYGAGPMLAIFALSAVAGAAAFAATTLPQFSVLVGASGGVAGLTGAAIRFIFQPPVVEVDEQSGERRLRGRRLATLRDVWANPSARVFTLFWIGINGVMPLLPLMTGQDAGIAWQAHLGGFAAGFLLVPLFERRAP